MAGIPILPIPASTWKASGDSSFASEPPPRSCYKAQGPRNGSHKNGNFFFGGENIEGRGHQLLENQLNYWFNLGCLGVESISTKVQEMTLWQELYLKGWLSVTALQGGWSKNPPRIERLSKQQLLHSCGCQSTDLARNKLTNKQTNERTNERTNEQTNKQTNKQTNEQTNERTNKQTNKSQSQNTTTILKELRYCSKPN